MQFGDTAECTTLRYGNVAPLNAARTAQAHRPYQIKRNFSLINVFNS
jgi:hypothetical protein